MTTDQNNNSCSTIEIANLAKAMNSANCSLEETDRIIRILAKKQVHNKQHPFKKFF